jgi:hypothetical protein
LADGSGEFSDNAKDEESFLFSLLQGSFGKWYSSLPIAIDLT